ncbi:MAG: FAD-dependent oxidoreductase, partial [Luteolibacter sp.]
MPRKLLIIGGGFAGLECASRLANDEHFEITLVDRTNHHLFQPLLYQVASASLAAPDIARSIRQILADAKNVT